jgi:ABC-type polysaccharide/polyol phosphate export permease
LADTIRLSPIVPAGSCRDGRNQPCYLSPQFERGVCDLKPVLDLQVGFSDLAEAWRRRQVALYFAWTETLARYRRSLLGPIWLVLSTLIGVGGLGLVWSALLKINAREFIPSLAVGLVTWQLISGAIIEATTVFSRAGASILNVKLPTFLMSFQLLFRHLINFAHNLAVVLLVLIVYPDHLNGAAFFAIPGLLIVAVSLAGVIQLFGFFGARFRDLEPLIGSFMPILFFLSPVIYQARQLDGMEYLMEFNPLAHWIRLIRDPMMGVFPTVGSYLSAIAILAAIWAAALWITSSRAHRLPYWV